ncbi:WD repeat-containing protein 7-like [Tigriopus californicus]|uniref:WD repeat-containing protein 7-like n=1 Tax=Tigriopus californicus TaxID=6832 RepID=UPI0027D9F5C9|nr:WD repeat-containing protein 7-like [Tigriopus californicus]|eukprot:TCALIF_01758-PA protein Name:"Similar to WDR7 WD repeat-containing protein 7 (Homo sapiens)" AED:0.14 eAED:0.14 QI:229/1/1/1/1/1/2/387/1474
MSSSSSLVVPLTLWGNHAPAHCISVLYLLRDQRTLVTGSSDGQILLWDVDPNAGDQPWRMVPRHMLVGHTTPVRCIAKASSGQDCHHIVSSSDKGEMFTWDTVDGRAIESQRYAQYVHSTMQAYRAPDSPVVKLFCSGFYEEILVMEPFALTVLFQLSSRINPDWVSAFHVLRPRNRNDDVVLALTTTGTVKVWTLNGDENQDTVFENESKQIRCINAISMTCCVYNMRTVLVVCSTYWNIYDAGDFTCLLTVDCRRGERWIGGEFISAERVCAWSDEGKAYLYKLPTNCIVESKDFHNKSKISGGKSLLFCELVMDVERPLKCPPAFKYLIFSRDGKWMKYLIRGDCDGRLAVWKIPDTPDCASMQLKHETSADPISIKPVLVNSLEEIWRKVTPGPVGVLNQLDDPDDPDQSVPLTSTIFLPMQCRLVCGRDDGSIIMVPATQTIMLQLLSGRHQKFTNWPQHQVLLGHSARVNCLLYPNNDHPRYDVAHLVSGSTDFTVCLWDIYTGTLLHRFSSHAGEISNLYVPPVNCSPRIQHCICSVASDNSVALLSLKEKRCVMLASRHLFPVTTIKWRPLDDFLIVGCSDGTSYVWQMDTGHLDRVVHGSMAEEILAACDENATITLSENVGANPAMHFFRGLRHRNLAAIKLATQSGMSNLHGKSGLVEVRDKSRAFPLVINGFRTNPKDSEGHILFFDVEALIVQLLTEEYSAMTPGTMEAQGFTNQKEYEKIWALTKPASPDAVKKLSGFLNKVKDRADDKINSISSTASPETQKKLTGFMSKVKEGAEKAREEIERAKTEIEKRAGALDGETGEKNSDSVRPATLHLEINLTLEIGQLLLSMLHAWGLDKELDVLAMSKLGLLRPKVPISFGVLSKGGVMSLTLPTWYPRPDPAKPPPKELRPSHIAPNLSKEEMAREVDTYYFTALGHWEISHAITTHHLLSVIAITNTLVSVSNASFIPEQEKKRKLVRQATHGAMDLPKGSDDSFKSLQEQIKSAWSLLSTLHCLLLSGKLKNLGSKSFKKPQVELLAQRWQDRCLQVRMAAQELLVAELKNLGTKGRKHLVEAWGQYLPKYGDPPFQMSNTLVNAHNGTNGVENHPNEEEEEGEDEEIEDESNSSAVQAQRNETTAVILLGVIGALFDLEAEREGKEVALGNHLTRLTAKALMFLVLSPQSAKQQSSGSLRRAAIDLIGRGFTMWEPHLEVSKVFLGLLDMCCEADWWVPSGKYGLPLTQSGDSCRTSRHSLFSIAKVRPQVFITSVAKEIARYNNLASNAQALNVNLARHVLTRSKAEILHLIEVLIEKNRTELADLLVDVTDITLHCIDHNHLKNKPLNEIFKPISNFTQVSHCIQTRRIAVGTRTGQLAMYELRASKVQMIAAHSGQIAAVAFAPDGKNLASYSTKDNRLCFWQTSTGMFGLGNAQTKCTRTYNTPALSQAVRWNPMYSPRLLWNGTKIVTLLLPDGTEHRFNC